MEFPVIFPRWLVVKGSRVVIVLRSYRKGVVLLGAVFRDENHGAGNSYPIIILKCIFQLELLTPTYLLMATFLSSKSEGKPV